MTTTLEVDETLLREAMQETGSKNARALVERQLADLVRLRRLRREMLARMGSVEFEEDVEGPVNP